MTNEEEQIIEDCVIEFADNGFPLRNADILDPIQMFVVRLPYERRKNMLFINGRPGKDILNKFMKRHPKLCMRRRAGLEQQRKLAMNTRTLAMHFARLKLAYEKYDILIARQVFYIDESGVSSRTGGRGKGKAAMRASGRSNSVEIQFSGNAEHLTIMPIVSSDGTPWRPVVILPCTLHKYRIRPDNTKETLHDYLPANSFITHSSPASMTQEIFLDWVEKFIVETEELRKEYKYILVTMDALGGHMSYRALQRMKNSNIIAYALPAHSSHRTQVLDYSVFGPLKDYLRTQWSMRLIGTCGERANDVFTLCEMTNNAYRRAVTYTNIVNGFSACGLWALKGGGVDMSVISSSDITNRDVGETAKQSYTRYEDLFNDFVATRDTLKSDGPKLINGHTNTTTGCLCDRDDLLRELQAQEDSREVERVARERREAERAQRRVEREEAARQAEERRIAARDVREARAQERAAERAAEVARRQMEKAEQERLKTLNREWDSQVKSRWMNLAVSRSARREAARLRVCGAAVATESPSLEN